MTKIGPKAQKVFDEVGYNISQEAKDAIVSLDQHDVATVMAGGYLPPEKAAELQKALDEAHARIRELEASVAKYSELRNAPPEEDSEPLEE